MGKKRIKLYMKYDEIWETKLNRLNVFIMENGRYPRWKSEDEEEKVLALWVDKQRTKYKEGSLRQDRERRLKEINFEWGTRHKSWETMYHEFARFLVNNNGRYPRAYSKNEEEKRLGIWVSKQRKAYKAGRLRKDRIKQLNENGFFKCNRIEEEWEKNFQLFKEFVSEIGKYPNMLSKDEKEKVLGNWVHSQRKAYHAGTLRKDREDKLNGIVFIWDARQASWENNCMLLNRFLTDNNGRYPSIESKNEEEKSLALWVSNQRQAIKKGKISLTRYRLLRRQKFIEDLKEEKNLAKANEQFFQEADQEWSR